MISNKLNPNTLRKLPDGMHGDGNYLWLRIKGNARSWIVRGPRINGKKQELGLGSVDRVSLQIARKKRDEALALWANDIDPIAERRAAREAAANRKTFAEVAEAYIEKESSGWRESFEGRNSTLDSWTRNVERDCAPIASKGIDELGVDDVERVLSPFWERGHMSSARDCLKRLEYIFAFALARKWRKDGTNPASWEIFKHLWPGGVASKKNHASLPWQSAPEFVRSLRESNAVTARVLEFAILTATRSGETRGATWREFDFDARTWTIPPARLKTGKKFPDKPHVVPLSDQAIALLERVKADDGEYVFPGYSDGTRRARDAGPIPNASVWKLVKRLAGDVDMTTHGFRATFKTWCGDHGEDRELAERSLAHTFGSQAEEAYMRTGLVARRAPVMQRWADYCCGGNAPANVLPFKRSA